ncbi:hypothetical protein LINGRAHAP2_LOCUS33233 [Linum grandiflorum]
MKKTFTGGAIPNSRAIYGKIRVLCEVTHVGWATISALSWILFFMFPIEELFLYVSTGYVCIILFYVVLAIAALSVTYAAYKFGERVEAGAYRLGCLVKVVDYLAFALIAVMAGGGSGGDRQTDDRLMFGLVGFMWEFHCLMKLGWNFLDYTFFEMVITDTACIFVMLTIRPTRSPMNYASVISCLLMFVLLGALKYLLHLTIFDTIEDRHCVMCNLVMERYPEKVVELLEGSVSDWVVVEQSKSSSMDD